MIRILAAVAALAALPTAVAAAPAASDQTDPAGIVVQARPYSYSIVIHTRGRDPSTVRREIWDAAYTACDRAPLTSNVKDLTVEAMQTCVNKAGWDGILQYSRQRRQVASR
ncbi:MAG TPA: hypothetical protein VL358_03045 [Caulobacteraceae bacterium]|jgi:hypothetical protein|nr:hypothetical protein [Caulobacteraceae bacterium]